MAMLLWNYELSCLLIISLVAFYSALCIFEKHMLAFVDLIHALPTRGRDSTQFLLWEVSCIQGEKCICSGGACIHVLWSSLSPDFSCALLPMVSSPFCLTLRSQKFWSILSRLCRVIALVLGDRLPLNSNGR